MDAGLSTQELQLCQHLIELPRRYGNRYEEPASRDLLYNLFWSMAGGRPENLRLFFPDGKLTPKSTLKLREAQGAVDGAEYTEAARGKACGHIFRAGEASYSCKTCSTDDTCCLCSKCFNATDHAGHMVRISISPGNSGCCDCGDPEAWKTPMFCTIHSEREDRSKGKGKEVAGLPDDVVFNIRMTISRVLDFICDVISCAPEQLRQPKTKESIERDEKMSRLASTYCGGDVDSPEEYALLLWNDEKHTVKEVQDQVARACSTTSDEGYNRAVETDSIGRSILKYDTSIERLLANATVLEHIKITVTIRSSRDTFREQMCGTMIDWLNDISGCVVGNDHNILRMVVCEELLKPWRKGSPGTNAMPGKDGLEDEEKLEYDPLEAHSTAIFIQRARFLAETGNAATLAEFIDTDDDDDEDMDGGNRTPSSEEDNDEDEDEDDDEDVMMIDMARPDAGADVNVSDWIAPGVASLEEEEATMAGYPPPPPPPPAPRRTTRDRDLTPSDSDTAEPLIAPTVYAKANLEIPKTPGLSKTDKGTPPKPGRYWVETPAAYMERDRVHPFEDVFQRVRLDWLILFDLRMWKKVRNDLRSLYISTVVTIPEFKRVLGLRFAALYTTLAQLYLIGDREPDHSIINISLQMLTTPSITAEVVERGNFLTTLMAILYTFLTTRQVGHPWEVSSSAVLGFDTGSVTNRRMYHFYVDLKFLLGSPHVQERMRTEERYLMQFLDLVKLHQGICPNIRAVGEHVEYETDSWIGASLMTREINRLCRLLSGSFRGLAEHDFQYLSKAIRLTAKSVIINSVGAERARFTQAEIKDEIRFKALNDFEFAGEATKFEVVKFNVEEQSISFHHALHYTLSWLIECGKHMSSQELRSILNFTSQELKLKPRSMGRKSMPRREYSPEDYLMAAFDYPLRVCTWLAQIKAGMWVRNGISLRHQAGTYKNILHRDVTHARDIFLLQTAMVVCKPSRVLASIIDRFGMERWIKGLFQLSSQTQDEGQHLDVVEDMIHFLIVLLSDRTSLIPVKDEQQTHLMAMRRDITHVLCFRPLSFNEIASKLPEKFHEHEDFQRVLDEVATFKSPEGVSDVGTFELKPQFIEDIDPYIAHYNKNQREESEAAYRKWMAKKTGKPIEEIVYEPRLRPIESGVFKELAQFTSTGMFAQIIYYCLLYPLVAAKLTPKVQFTRIETFLQVVLHLILIAIAEDKAEASESAAEAGSFVYIALTTHARSNFMQEAPNRKTIVSLLDMMSTKEELKACHAKIALILKRMRQKYPQHFDMAYNRLGIPVDRIDTASPASTHNIEEERERKKKAALDRQAKVMAQFQQQQKSFLEMQGDIDWGEDEWDDMDEMKPVEEQKNFWKYPRGTCILCQEDTDDGRLYGTFALFTESKILRQTDLQDPDFVREAAATPANLDRSAETLRPFGLAHENREVVEKVNADGETFVSERQGLGKGFPAKLCRTGPVSVGCGHIMHFSCFDMYMEATVRRHGHQIARHHPEALNRLEFVCPLCKALGNAFLPISWDGKEESYPGILQTESDFSSFLSANMTDPQNSIIRSDQSQTAFVNYLRTKMPDCLEKTSASITPFSIWEPSTFRAIPSVSSSSDTFSLGGTPSSSIRSHSPESQHGDKELMMTYRRLRDTLRKNKLVKTLPSENRDDDLIASDVLAWSVGFSISAAEIQQRGVEAQYGMTLIERMPEQLLVQLRILSETVSSYIAVGGLRNGGDNQIEVEFRTGSERQFCQLFPSQFYDGAVGTDEFEPLFSQDTFIFLCEAMFGVSAALSIDPMHLVRLCYLAEIVKVVYNVSQNLQLSRWLEYMGNRNSGDPAMNNFANFFHFITVARMNLEPPGDQPNNGFDQPGLDSLESLHSFVRKYALVFLRKVTILLHVHLGVDFNSHISPVPEADELTRLTAALRLPSFDEMCTAPTPLGTQYGWPPRIEVMIKGWLGHQVRSHKTKYLASQKGTEEIPPMSAQLSHPGIFELVGLPRNFDTLIEECAKRRCPKTGKDLADPIVCLMCGDIFCGQTMCCLMEYSEPGPDKPTMRIGGAQQHMLFKCQGNIGLFINIRKCAIFYLHRTSGSFSQAPYIDKYGEVDVGLRHGRQLFLNQKRYDSMLRNLWLSHGVPSFISRKLEADINSGGWETI